MATVPRVLTYEEWLRMPPIEDGIDEVVRGELRLMPPTRYPHAEIIRRLISAINRQVDQKQVIVLGSNFGLLISREPLTCRSPDLALYWNSKIDIRDGLYYSPPGLIVEVLSPSENRLRKEEKVRDYATIGVPEVWLCSPEAQSVEVLRLRDGELASTSIQVGGTLEPSEFPGVQVSIPSIWPDEGTAGIRT